MRGFDVVASKRLTVGFVLFPLQSAGFVGILFLLQYFYFGNGLLQSFGFCCAVSIGWPIYCYLCVIYSDSLLTHYRFLRFRIISLLYKKNIEYVRDLRGRLVKRLKEVLKARQVEVKVQRGEEAWFSEDESFLEMIRGV